MSTLPSPVASVQEPDLRALLFQLRSDMMTSLNCHQVGEIVSFDADKQTATVQLKIQRLFPDRTKSPPEYVAKTMPLLVDCPVFILAGSNGHMTFPIAAGDSCLVLFSDRDVDNWFDTGATLPPNSLRTHDLSDGFALIGWRNKANKLAAFNTTTAELAFAGGKLKVADKFAMDGASGSLKTTLQKIIDALTALNAKTGPTAATEITAAQTAANNFLL